MKTARFSVDSIAILEEARNNFIGVKDKEAAIGLVMGLTLIGECLRTIAKRAVELDDADLLATCEQLCIVKRAET